MKNYDIRFTYDEDGLDISPELDDTQDFSAVLLTLFLERGNYVSKITGNGSDFLALCQKNMTEQNIVQIQQELKTRLDFFDYDSLDIIFDRGQLRVDIFKKGKNYTFGKV